MEDNQKWEKIEPKCKLNEIELKPKLRESIKEILEDRDFAHALEDEGLKPRKLIMLHGPPGCGKTSIAHGIAAETGLPLYLASGAQLVSCYVGESEKNAEKIFQFTAETECVMLLDEFEGFASDRANGSKHEHRLVNTFLVNMETRPPKGIMVCATNFHDDIDPAVLRRFDMIIEVPQLSHSALLKVAEAVLKGRFDISAEECVQEGKTPSGTVRAAKNKLRSAVLQSERKNPRPKPVKSTPEYIMPEPIYAQQIVPLGYGVGCSRFGMGDMEKIMQEAREKIMQGVASPSDQPRTYDENKKQQRYQFYQRQKRGNYGKTRNWNY